MSDELKVIDIEDLCKLTYNAKNPRELLDIFSEDRYYEMRCNYLRTMLRCCSRLGFNCIRINRRSAGDIFEDKKVLKWFEGVHSDVLEFICDFSRSNIYIHIIRPDYYAPAF